MTLSKIQFVIKFGFILLQFIRQVLAEKWPLVTSLLDESYTLEQYKVRVKRLQRLGGKTDLMTENMFILKYSDI